MNSYLGRFGVALAVAVLMSSAVMVQGQGRPSGVVFCELTPFIIGPPIIREYEFAPGLLTAQTVGDAVWNCLEDGGRPKGVRID